MSSIPLHEHLLRCECEMRVEHMLCPQAGSVLHHGAAHHSEQHASIPRHIFHMTRPLKANQLRWQERKNACSETAGGTDCTECSVTLTFSCPLTPTFPFSLIIQLLHFSQVHGQREWRLRFPDAFAARCGHMTTFSPMEWEWKRCILPLGHPFEVWKNSGA